MPQTHPAPKGRTRLAAAATGAALVAGVGGLVIAGAPAANAADQNLNKSFAYSCDLYDSATPTGTPLVPNNAVGVNARVVVPTSVAPNQLIGARKTQITLTMPEDLRKATYGLLGGRKAGGRSNDASITIADSGSASLTVPIRNLASPPVTVPSAVGASWTIPTQGDVPAIKLPSTATGTGTLTMPARFTVLAQIYKADNSKLDVSLDCSITSTDKTLGTIAISGTAYRDARLTAAATTATYGRASRITARLSAAVGGRVDAYVGTRRIGAANVSGTTASIPVSGTALRPGAYTVTLRHSGAARVNPVAAVNTRLTVRKAGSSLAAKVSPKKIRAKRTKAKVSVTVRTSGFKATGRVTAKVGKKTVGKGTVRNGKVTIKLKKFKKKGTYRVKLTYGGSAYANGSTKTVKVKVRR
ncbi:Ig-like domain repeat protein [Mumia sp. zg.B21]|uniref:DUF6801 domain-containing protein n=1 Tax=Mumia sp. zg.B21 TaxID=2855447 RepID=UPI001C6E1B6E|nr:DUF6801 domain-containing protein [Mumia sp. zg.B21]MBW9210075.1 Ig-like domain repeat protein [Mumia sp. zg.B21]